MAGYKFQDATVSVFDNHTTVLPHLSDAVDSYQAPFMFLTDSTMYNQRYQTGQVVSTPHLDFGNLPMRSQHSHFWNAYAFDQLASSIDYWMLNIPLVGRLRKPHVILNMNYSFQISLSIRIWLSPLGWSTMLITRLQGNILKKELVEVMGKLTGRVFANSSNINDHPFLIEGRHKSLTDLFKHFQDLLFEEIYTPGKIPHPAMKIPRHFVVSLNKYHGDTVDYKHMPPADQGLMLSILYGSKIDATDIVGGKLPNVNWTKISGPNFSLTDFNHGTLVFPQREAQNPEREGAVHCLVNNIRESLLMILTQMYFYKLSKDNGPENRVTELRNQSKENLIRIRSKYPNEYCQNLFRQHNYLSQLSFNLE